MDQIGSYVYLLYNSFPVQLLFTQCKDILHIFLPLPRHFEVRYSSNKTLAFPRLGFSSKAFLSWPLWFLHYLSPPAKGKHDFYFFFFALDPRSTTASWRSRAAGPGTTRGFLRGMPEPQKVFFFPDFQDSVSLNHTTYPAVSFLALVHFPLCFYQPIPTEF